MKVMLAILSGVVLAVALCSVPVAAQPPVAPTGEAISSFYGTVTIGGCPAPDGLTVSAKVEGVEYDTAITVDGSYGRGPWDPRGEHMLKVPGDDPVTSQKDGGRDGDTVEFFVEGVKANETAIFKSMDYLTLNLTVPSFVDYYTVTLASYTPTVGAEFTITITAYDLCGFVVTTDSTTQVTMTSSSGTMLFDADGDGSFDDNVKTLSSGSFDIAAKDTVTASGVTITATDGNGKTGTSLALTISEEGAIVPSSIYFYTVTSTSDSYAQTVGAEFTVTVTACDPSGEVVNTDSATQVTMTSCSVTMLFDANGDGSFDDNMKTLSSGSFDIAVKDTVTASGVTITATDGNGKTGTSPPFTVTGEPTVTGVNPDQGNQGETLDVTMTGSNFTAASAVDFGAGITVNSFTVVDSTQITANITIDADATTGARHVSVSTPGGTGTLSGGFTVEKKDDQEAEAEAAGGEEDGEAEAAQPGGEEDGKAAGGEGGWAWWMRISIVIPIIVVAAIPAIILDRRRRARAR